jgi:hypothetical protein
MTQLSVTQACVSSNDPRKVGQCLRCSTYARGQGCPDPAVRSVLTTLPEDPLTVEERKNARPRDVSLERELTQLAALAGGNASDYGLRDYADSRAWPGGVRRDLDCDREALEELADCASYLVWGIVPLLEAVHAGVPDALDKYERRMRALSALIVCWRELLTEAA